MPRPSRVKVPALRLTASETNGARELDQPPLSCSETRVDGGEAASAKKVQPSSPVTCRAVRPASLTCEPSAGSGTSQADSRTRHARVIEDVEVKAVFRTENEGLEARQLDETPNR